MNRTLIVMVKEPRPGRVKTRLARGIGTVAAAWWFRHQVARLLRDIRDPRWRVVLAVAPDRAVAARALPALPRIAQGKGTLGDRMARAIRSAGPGPVCVIGADIPGVSRAALWKAFRGLVGNDAVFGPAPDGGYWLVGVRNGAQPPATLFETVRWSTPHALSDSIASVPGARIALVDELADVDEAADLPGKASRP